VLRSGARWSDLPERYGKVRLRQDGVNQWPVCR
jgi:hypothetical protein